MHFTPNFDHTCFGMLSHWFHIQHASLHKIETKYRAVTLGENGDTWGEIASKVGVKAGAPLNPYSRRIRKTEISLEENNVEEKGKLKKGR